MLPFRPTPFFADKNRAFWNLQFIGWGGSMLLRSITNIANGTPLAFLVLTLIATITGFSISLILSVIYGKLINQRPLVTWSATALVLAVAVGVAALIDGWTISLWRGDSDRSFASLVLGVFYMDMTLLGAWSALYYAINYYLQVEQQADQFALVVIVRGEVAEVAAAAAVGQPGDGAGVGERHPVARLARLQAGDFAPEAAQVVLDAGDAGAARVQRAVIVREAFGEPQLARVLLLAVIVRPQRRRPQPFDVPRVEVFVRGDADDAERVRGERRQHDIGRIFMFQRAAAAPRDV